MKRLLSFAVAMGLATAAHAETFSFTIGGQHISISTARNCYRAACVSVSIPGRVTSRRKRSDEVATRQDPAPSRPAPKTPAIAAPAPWVAPAPQIASPPVEKRSAVPNPAPPPAPKLAATDTKDIAAPPPPPPAAPVKVATTEKPAGSIAPAPPAQDVIPADKTPAEKTPADKSPAEQLAEKPPVAPPPAAALPASDPAPVLKVEKVVDTARDDSPLGDWLTEGKTGAVRIEACGKALCGYLINPSSQAKGESILINMKPHVDSQFRGSIFSRASGNTYNATMTLKSANVLRVEACALGHFFCSRNDWTRVIKDPDALVTSRDDANAPRS